MGPLFSKIRGHLTRRVPAITLRRTRDPVDGFVYQVRVSIDRSSLEHLGCCKASRRDEILELLREQDYDVDEVLEGRTWVCRPREACA